MNLTGIIIGLVTFAIIGVFHPIVIQCEYHFTQKIWPVFLVFGILSIAASFFVGNTIGSAAFGVLGWVLLWSIHEIKEQSSRVEKGWFPSNPKRKQEQKETTKV